MRQTLLVLHRYLALVSAIFLALVAASGCVLVFEGAIDRALNPRLWYVPVRATPALSLDTLAARVHAARPTDAIAGVAPAQTSDRATVFTVGRGTQVFVDPNTGAIQGVRTAQERDRSFARRAHIFHETLMAKALGSEVVGLVTSFAFLLVVTGIPLWWKRKIVTVGGGSWKRVVFDLHHATGIAASVVLAAMTFTGVWMHYDWMTRAIRSLDGTVAVQAKQPPAPPDSPTLSFDTAVRTARTALPGAAVMAISSPPEAEQPIVVSMRFPEDRTPGGRSRVTLNRFSGAVLRVQNTRTAPLGTRLDNLKRSIHTGDVFGKPSEAVWLLSALVMVLQAVTGVLMWWHGRSARGSASARAQRVVQSDHLEHSRRRAG